MKNVLEADYYDGKSSTRHAVSLILGGGKLKIVGESIDLQVELRGVRRSLRIGNTPRWLYLPGGGACVTSDNDAVDRLARKRRYDRLLQAWESRPTLAALAVALVAACTWLMVSELLPRAADEVASRIPVEAESVLGQQALQGMDRVFLQRSSLSGQQQVELSEKFYSMMRAAGDSTPYRLEFRASPALGANAFALPSGIIVVLDDLVKLGQTDEQVLGVLAHEVGHVHHRHTLRRLLEGSAAALLIAGLTGDVASTTSLAAAAPALLLQTKYSRDNEREADAYAVELMKKAGVDGRALAVMLGRLQKLAARGRRPGMPTFLSSHPATEERRAAILAALGTSVDAQESERPREAADRRSDVSQLAGATDSQREILALLENGDLEGLERTLSTHQRRFEQDASNEPELYGAFRTFRSAGLDAEPTLRRWREQMPQSYSASLALGLFYLWHGVDARGTDFIAETPDENLRAMRELLAKARPELERSLSLTSKPYLSHLSLMTLSRYVGDRDAGRRHYLAGIELSPNSVRLRLARMTALEPIWGGSYEEMEALARESAAQLRDPADAAKVAARVPAARAAQFGAEHRLHEAVSLYDEALRLDPSANELRCERAWTLTQYGRHAEAFEQASDAFARDRHARLCVRAAIYAARRIGDQKKLIDFATQAVNADARWPYPYVQRGWAHEKEGRREAAFQDYLAAAQLGDPWAEMRVGHGYFMGWGVAVDRDEGIAWLRKATAHGNVEARGMLDKALQLTAQH